MSPARWNDPTATTDPPTDPWIRYHGEELLRELGGESPLFNLGQVLATFSQNSCVNPANNPSLPYREYQLGDEVAINEVVIRNVNTGFMMVVYPGSQERAKWCWPDWVQVYVG